MSIIRTNDSPSRTASTEGSSTSTSWSRGRDLRLPRAQRRRQDDDHPHPARPHPADVGQGVRVRHRVDRRSGRDPPPDRLHPGRVRAVRPPDRRPDDRVLRQPARRRGPGVSRQLVKRLDIDPSRKFKEYSKGNKQKVGLVIALQHQPELLILDEPTSGLDPLVQQSFYELVREAQAEGRTVFLSSHILSEVEKTCDRVAIIRDGGLVKVDRSEALRDLAHHEVELRFAAAPSPRMCSRACPACPTSRSRPHAPDARQRPDHTGRPGGRAVRAARLRQP